MWLGLDLVYKWGFCYDSDSHVLPGRLTRLTSHSRLWPLEAFELKKSLQHSDGKELQIWSYLFGQQISELPILSGISLETANFMKFIVEADFYYYLIMKSVHRILEKQSKLISSWYIVIDNSDCMWMNSSCPNCKIHRTISCMYIYPCILLRHCCVSSAYIQCIWL